MEVKSPILQKGKLKLGKAYWGWIAHFLTLDWCITLCSCLLIQTVSPIMNNIALQAPL